MKRKRKHRKCKKCIDRLSKPKPKAENVLSEEACRRIINRLQLLRNYHKMTMIQQLHHHCKGKSVFTEEYLSSYFTGKRDLVQQGLNEFPDIFVCNDRIIIASTTGSKHRAVWFGKPSFYFIDKTRYHQDELLYLNGKISSDGVSFCDTNKTIQNADISFLFEEPSEPEIPENLNELIIYGYARKYVTIDSLLQICISYYVCKEEFAMYGDRLGIVGDNRCKIKYTTPYGWCCAFGSFPIDSNTTNHYQWLLYIDKKPGFSIGITSERNVNELFDNDQDYPKYSYSSNGLVRNCNQAPFRHKGKRSPFEAGDTILMDLDFSKNELKFVINGNHLGCLIKDIIRGPIYYFGVCMGSPPDQLTIKRFNWFNDTTST